MRFTRLMALISLGIALSTSAQAADIAARNYTKAAIIGPSYNWSGAYVGLNVGGVWGSVTPNYASQSGVTTTAGLVLVQGMVNPDMNSSNFIGGGQIGYNFQNQWSVYGVEADLSYARLSQTRSTGTFGLPVCGGPCEITQSYGTDWLATFRGRFGVTAGNLLLYGTGGVAIAGIRYSDTFNLPSSVSAASSNGVRAGWALGAGVEWALDSNWTVKAEYLYVDLGSASYALRNNVFPAATLQVHHELVENIARLGINYRF